MTATTAIHLCVSLPFEDAGIAFRIEVTDPDSAESGPGFLLSACGLDDGDRLRFRSDVSPVLADWVRGYTRWLYRARISAHHTEDGITGQFAAGVTPEQVFEGLQLACDMIRQRFELYEESVLV